MEKIGTRRMGIMPMVAQWDINDDCNLNCKHCRVLDKNTKEKELTLKQAKSLLSEG